MKTYCLWQTNKKAERQIDICDFHQPTFERPNVVYASMRDNPFFNCIDFNFCVHSDQKLNKSKVFGAFMRAKKELIKSGNDSLSVAININDLI